MFLTFLSYSDLTKDKVKDSKMITVEGGTFQMGCQSGRDDINDLDCERDESPVHAVTVSTFKMSKYEITNAQYVKFLNAVGVKAEGTFNETNYGEVEYIAIGKEYKNIPIVHNGHSFELRKDSIDYSNYPVVLVTWYGAQAYCKWAGGRLPTEAEWEFVARGGNKSKGYQFSGSNQIDSVVWYSDNSYENGSSNFYGEGNKRYGTHPVGQKSPNELGLYDMNGNVWEWCQDWYGRYSSSSQINPIGPSRGTTRVLRGGGWNYRARSCRVSDRYHNSPNGRYDYGGFRLVVLP